MAESNNITDRAQGAANGFESLTRMLRILFFCFLSLIIAVCVYYFIFSGIFRVDEQYEAMLLRFGVLQERMGDHGSSPILESGKWYWSYPYPVDEVIMVPANKSVSVSTENTFKAWIAPNGAQAGAANRELRTGVDGYLVNGDMHLFHAEWVVSYRVENAANYYLNFYDDNDDNTEQTLAASEKNRGAGLKDEKKEKRLRGHELIIRNMLSDAVLTETANWTTEQIIKASRSAAMANGEVVTERIEDGVRRRMAALVDKIGLGIEIQTVTLVGLYQPPAAALQAFNRVNASERNKQTEIQNAEAFANSLLSQANANRERVIGEAQAYRETVVRKLQADAQYFLAIQKEYNKNPQSTMTVLYTDAIKQMLASVPTKYILHDHEASDGRQQLRLQISSIPEKARSEASQAVIKDEAASVQPGK